MGLKFPAKKTEADYMWYLCRVSIQQQWEFSTDLACAEHIAKELNTPDHDWMLWREGFQQWTPATQVDVVWKTVQATRESAKKKSSAPPPLPKRPPPIPEKLKSSPMAAQEKIAAVENHRASPIKNTPIISKAPNKKSSKQDELRKHPRHDARMRVIVRSQQITFRTFTTNISAGGVALEHAVPADLLNQECVIYLSDPNTQANIKFKTQIVPNRNEAKYFTLTHLSLEDEERFATWLAHFSSHLAAS